ncbi:MAG: hypothetical protein P4K83_01865 [Terracidiphilus sp.]|nr:hypothetical protein [Terracidiphilus sp.]
MSHRCQKWRDGVAEKAGQEVAGFPYMYLTAKVVIDQNILKQGFFSKL